MGAASNHVRDLAALHRLAHAVRENPEIIELKVACEEVRRRLPRHLLEFYQRRRRLGGRLLAPMLNDSCVFCGAEVPLARRMVLQADIDVLTCQSCGVLLYAPQSSGASESTAPLEPATQNVRCAL